MTVIVDLFIASASSTCRPRLRLDRRPGDQRWEPRRRADLETCRPVPG